MPAALLLLNETLLMIIIRAGLKLGHDSREK